MALNTAAIVATIDLNVHPLLRSAAQAEATLNNLDGAGTGAFSGAEQSATSFAAKVDALSGKLIKFGGVMTAAVTTPVVGAFGLMFSGAADLEQSIGATEQIFGSSASSILAWSETSADAFGMTQDEALTSVNNFNAMFKQLDEGQDVIARMSQGFVGLSADLSAMWGGTSLEASESLTSALRGNYEGLDKYNVNLTEAMVSQEAMNVALAEGRSEITEADKVQARYNLIMEQTTDAQGQFAREAETASGSMAIMRANLGDAAAGFGRLLLPAGTKAAKMLTDLVKRIDSLSDTQKAWVLGIAGAAAAIGPLAIGLGTAMKAVTTFGTAFKAVAAVVGLLTSPIGLIVVGIAALAAGLIYAYQTFEPFRNAVDRVASALKAFALDGIEKAVEAFNKLKAAFDTGGWSQLFSTLGDMLLNGLQQLSDTILNGVQQLGEWFADAFSSIDWGGIVSGAWDVLSGAGSWILDKIGDIGGALWDWAWNGLSSVDWLSVASQVWTGLTTVAGWVADKITAAGELGARLFSWAWDALSDVDWIAVAGNVWSALTGIGGWIIEKIGYAGELTARLFTWAWDAISGVKWEGLFKLAVDTLKNAGTWIKDLITGTDIYQGLKTWAESAFQGISDAFDTVLGWLKGKVEDLKQVFSDLIQKYNEIGALPDVPNPFETAQDRAEAFLATLGDIKSALLGGAINATWESSGSGGSRMPYGGEMVPLQGGGGDYDTKGVSGITEGLRALTAAAQAGDAALQPIPPSVASIAGQSAAVTAFGTAATSAFTQSGVAAQTGLSPIGGLAATMAGALLGSAIPAFSGIQASASTNFAAMQAAVAGGTLGASVAAAANSASMLASVTSNASSMNTNASSEASSMSRSVSTEAAAMQLGMVTKAAAMAVTTAAHFATMLTSAKTAGTGITSALRDGANNAASAVQSALGRIPGIVGSVGSSAAATARTVGANIGNSMAAGMESALWRIQAAANAMVAAADTAVRARARIASPSKLFRRMGMFVGEGFELGIRSMIPDVARASSALVHVPGLSGNTYGVYGRTYTPAYAYTAAAPSHVTTITYGDINVTQQPGEDGEALARRIGRLLNDTHDSVAGEGSR